MAHFVGLDVSVKETSVCVVDNAGKVILEQKVPTEPDTLIPSGPMWQRGQVICLLAPQARQSLRAPVNAR